MSERDRLGDAAPWVIVALGLLIIALFSFVLVYSKGYQRADKDHEADYAAHYAAQRDYEECLAKPTVKEAVECTREADKAYRENARADQDLNAQREMADWAESMLWATTLLGFASLIIGGVGVLFVNRTLRESQEANALLLADQRPWVTYEREIPCVFSVTDFGATCHWTYIINNRGRLPARRSFLAQRIVRYDELLELRSVFSSFVDECKLRARGRLGRIVLPGLEPAGENWAVVNDRFNSTGESYALLTAMTYLHSHGVGLDAQVHVIEANKNFSIGPRVHRLIGVSWERLIE